MSVLKKIGMLLVTAGADITKIMGFPFISELLSAIPGRGGQEIRTIAGELSHFAGFIFLSEVAFPSIAGAKTGSQKLKFAAPLVEKSILLWAHDNLPGHSKLLVPAEKFAQDVQNFTSSFADILNDFGD